MKPISMRGLNTRLRRLEAEFGADSEVFKTAVDYIAERIPKANLTKKGYIRQDKSTIEKLGEKRWTSYDEYVPTVSDIYKREYDNLTNEDPDMLDPNQVSITEAKKNPSIKNLLARKANESAHLLNNTRDVLDVLYDAKDAKTATNGDEFEMKSLAQQYYDELKENGWLGRQLEWLNKVVVVTDAFTFFQNTHDFAEEY